MHLVGTDHARERDGEHRATGVVPVTTGLISVLISTVVPFVCVSFNVVVQNRADP